MATNSKVRERLIEKLGNDCAQKVMRLFGGNVLRVPVPGPSLRQIHEDIESGRSHKVIALTRGIHRATVNRAGKRA